MANIKISQLKELFTEAGLDEGIFDIFRSKSKKLSQRLKGIDSEIETVIASAPDKATQQKLRNLNNALKAYDTQRRKMGR
tara:strand:+ start:1442 stop:1681 length:240 start_codon:yes stop_codon:yes gene_type:complete